MEANDQVLTASMVLALQGALRVKSFVLAITFAVACAGAASQTKSRVAPSSDTFTPQGQVVHLKANESPTFEPETIEKGTLNGVAYYIFRRDLSASIAGTVGNAATPLEKRESNWHVYCNKDKITDDKFCVSHFGSLRLYVRPANRITVAVGVDWEHVPGSSMAIRIDGGKPFEAVGEYFGAKESLAVVQALKSAKTVVTRYMKAPHKSWVDAEFNVYGFNEALAYASWAVQRFE